MTENALILHHYDISPFSQKAQKMMGLKGLDWLSVEMPLIAPKPDVEALTGGYRGTPILQVGADVFIDNWMIARALDSRAPAAPLNPRGPLEAAALYAWCERLFIPLLHSAFATYKNQWEPDFLADRKQVFPDVDFDSLHIADPDRRSQVNAFLGEAAAQLGRGASFLGGETPDGGDVHVWGMIWMIYSALPDLVPLVERYEEIMDWHERMERLGRGGRTDVTFDAAWDALRAGHFQPLPDTPMTEPLRDWLGARVEVSAGSADRGMATGRLIAVDQHQVVIATTPLGGAEAHVWFPRFGYHLNRQR
jgi:glutathione S-transferase